MKKNFKSCVILFSISAMLFSYTSYRRTVSHRKNFTLYNKEAIQKYSHGPDGSIFIDENLKEFLQKSTDKIVLDIGCGTGEWSILAAEHQAKLVKGIDIQEKMIRHAKKNVYKSAYYKNIKIERGDAAVLPIEADFTDLALDILVACNLPNNTFEKHFKELNRVLRSKGEAIIVAPYSLNVVFTENGVNEDAIVKKINNDLKRFGENYNEKNIVNLLIKYKSVLSATFAINDNGELFLVRDLNELKEGQEIWRKLPDIVIPNFYHSYDSYILSIKAAGLKITKIVTNHFETQDERIKYNKKIYPSSLGDGYVNNSPFVIYYIEKE